MRVHFSLDLDDILALLHELFQRIGSSLGLDLVKDRTEEDLDIFGETLQPTI
jgi:hypothetical protein